VPCHDRRKAGKIYQTSAVKSDLDLGLSVTVRDTFWALWLDRYGSPAAKVSSGPFVVEAQS
jgi:hypothetical protein